MANDFVGLSSDLRLAAGKMEREASTVVRRAALDVRNHATRNAPVDTGFLQSSIDMASDGSGLTAIISPTAMYSHFVEHGTIYMAAQPYMGPAADAVEPAFAAAMEQLGRSAI